MKILLADGHALSREGLRRILKQLEGEHIILEAQSCANALDVADKHPDLDLMLLDFNISSMSGILAVGKLRQRHPSIPLVVLSASVDPNDVACTLNQGARGYIPKTSSSQVLLGALRLVISGGIYIPPEYLARRGSQTARPTAPAAYRDSWHSSAPGLSIPLTLTERQAQVLTLMAQGKPNKIIARELNMAAGTVKCHVSAILRALKVTNRTQAVIAVAGGGEFVPFPAWTPQPPQGQQRWIS